MRLLKRDSDGKLGPPEDFIGKDIPAYGILSHTWGPVKDEVIFQDLVDDTYEKKPSYEKICFCEKQSKLDGLEYFWVDTCCIDKSNNTELAEAINSMFVWYRNAAKCYVYLSDVSAHNQDQVDSSSRSWPRAFQGSRWFTRGWTFQELLAPASVEFFSSNRDRLGDKKSLERQIYERTRVPVAALRGTRLSTFSIKDRMSWAKDRETTRPEDKAYSLLGICEVHMPLIYGEGGDNALSRLREECYRREKKRQRDELSTVLQPTLDSTKRLKTPCSQTSIPFRRSPEILDPEPHFYPERSVGSIDATTKQSLIDQLYFTKIDDRLTHLAAAQGTTCHWFLSKSEYKSWNDMEQQQDHGGFLWIKGHPGTGKSTLMKLLFEEAKRSAKGNPSRIILSFFFLAQGTDEETSTTGLYRSLLHQLFEKAEDLKDSMEWMTADGARGIGRNGWHEEALKQTLTHAVQKLGTRSLTIFIDALDECDKDQATGMVCFLEELCDFARDVQVRLQICLSSRHYPTIIIQNGIEVTLEDEIGHTEDIRQYIKSKLRLGKSKQAESLRSDILEKSSGIFLWVVLVLDILNSEYPNCSISIKEIRQRLEKIPPKLSDLFNMIITRHGENLDQLHVCLKWILFATRPLKPQELYFAIQCGLEKRCSGAWDQEDVNLDQMKTFVTSSSKGLAEVTRNKASEVQFIHESVRDFLLGKYNGQWSGNTGNFIGHAHETLKNCCLAQLNASISQYLDIPDPLPRASQSAQFRDTINLKFPFLGYTISGILQHANSAQQKGIDQRRFLTDFPLQQWVFLNNILEVFDIRRYTKSVSLIYILAEKNLPNLIQIHSQATLCFDVGDERYGPPFFAALATGSSEAVRVLLSIQAEMHPSESPFHDLCKQYCQDRNRWANLGRDFRFSRSRGIASYLAEHGDEVLLSFLSKLGKCNPHSEDKMDRTPLWWATQAGHEGIVKLLLETDNLEVDSMDYKGRTPLSRASENGHVGIVKLLLAIGKADVNSRDMSCYTPLCWASQAGHDGVVKLLLETDNLDVDLMDFNSRTPLSWASKNGHEGIVKLLLATGKVEVNSLEKYGRTPLSWASQYGHEAIVKLLLATDKVGVNTIKPGRTPLSLAASAGHDGTVKLLLSVDNIEVNSRDNFGWTALSWAAHARNESTVAILLDTGKANCTQRDVEIAGDHEGIKKLLRDAVPV